MKGEHSTAKEESLSKSLYKIELLALKIIPMLIAGLYLANSVLSYFGVDIIIFSLFGGMSILPLVFLYITSYTFRFCAYHRMFLHYVLVCDVLNYVDYYYGIPLSDKHLFVLHMILAGLFLFIILFLRMKVCKHSRI